MARRETDGQLLRAIETLPGDEKFFAFALVVLDFIIGALALTSSGSLKAFLGVTSVVVLLVIVILVWRLRVEQNRLQHDRRVIDDAKFAESLADDICEMYEGSMRNGTINRVTIEADIRSGYELLFDGVSNRTLSEAENHFVEVFIHKVKVNADRRRKGGA